MGRFNRLMAIVALAAVAGAGCTPAQLWWLTKGDGKVAAKYPLPAKEGKKEVTVAILATSAPTLSLDFIGSDRELAGLLGKELQDGTKKASKPIKMIDQATVDKYLAKHPNWKVSSPGRIAKELGADYLLDVNLTSASLHQPEFGREWYAGRAIISVAVYDADSPDQPMKEYTHPARGEQKDGAIPAAQYRQYFVERIARELAWKHVEHVSERELPPLN